MSSEALDLSNASVVVFHVDPGTGALSTEDAEKLIMVQEEVGIPVVVLAGDHTLEGMTDEQLASVGLCRMPT